MPPKPPFNIKMADACIESIVQYVALDWALIKSNSFEWYLTTFPSTFGQHTLGLLVMVVVADSLGLVAERWTLSPWLRESGMVLVLPVLRSPADCLQAGVSSVLVSFLDVDDKGFGVKLGT